MSYYHGQIYSGWIRWAIPLIILTVAVQLLCQQAMAACATVKIEISQEVTLERQAFDAHMRIKNDLEGLSLGNVNVDVVFTDGEGNTVTATSNPNNTNALFYIAVDSMSGITDVSGSGVISPSSVADIHWLIIPAISAGGAKPEGVLYYVGAKLSYTLGETSYVTEVMPDYIYVKPLPNLALDYFLPSQVYGDDAFTEEVEPSVPFSLGLRLLNIGAGSAYNLKIDTAEPKITDNANGLLVAFDIRGCEVNGITRSASLLADLGTIAPGTASAARWEMVCSLSGIFTEFTASVSHSDELGGQLTSLIQPANLHTHLLVHDVQVDLPGRDNIRDYLAEDGYVYESEGMDSSVACMDEEYAQLDVVGTNLNMTPSVSSWGFIYVKLSVSSNQVLTSVARSDGKQILPANFWISRERKLNPAEGWDYYFNLFDVNASDCFYLINRSGAGGSNHPPVLAALSPVWVVAGQPVGGNISAFDEDGTVPALSAGSLPSGAQFTDGSNGIGFFSWTPSSGQTGFHEVVFTATDGVLSDTKSLEITVVDAAVVGPFPSWWTRRNILQNDRGTNDFAAVNQGQLKHIAAMAWQEINALPGGAGFTLTLANTNNYVAVNLGQLKYTVQPFYDRLYMSYPWIGAPVTNDFAIANIGQVKYVFSFDPAKDTDGDGMPDWWETHYNLNPNNPSDAAADPDSDFRINRDEYIQGTDPHMANE